MRGRDLLLAAGLAVLLLGGGAVEVEALRERRELEYAEGQPIGETRVSPIDGVLMTEAMARAWEPMREAAAAAGVTLRPSSGFRTMAEQEALWERHLAGELTTPVARPGWSKHQSGRALDIHVGGNSTSSAEFLWLQAHAGAFGWVNAGAAFQPPEWWHWELA